MKRFGFLLILVAAVFAPHLLQAKDSGEGVVNKLLAPGPLIVGHENLEHGECLQCHDAGNGVPDNKCMACHKPIAKDVTAKTGFHGHTKVPCIGCHTDHKGRGFNTTFVNTKTFNHELTGFTLHGAHARLACAKCHTAKRTSKPIRSGGIRFFGQTTDCKSCHKKDDVHFFSGKWAAKDCNSCHNDISWKRGASFDHRKETGYALVGDHAQLKCAQCHAPHGRRSAKYQFPELKSRQCLSCHVDFHKNNLSPKFQDGNCDRCHTQTSWKIATFDHTVTGFLLKGAHARTACIDCHKQPGGVRAQELKRFHFTGLGSDCASCHKDYHGFARETSPKLGGSLLSCQKCHTESAWKAQLTFNHNRDTDYALDGKHLGVTCFACHKPKPGLTSRPNVARVYEFPQLAAKTCETCHKSPHTATSSPVFRRNNCSSCHTTDGWAIFKSATDGGFNHSTMTRFPLTGDHASLKCDSCHLKGHQQVYKFAGANKQFCATCHASVHRGQFDQKFLTASCATCHNTTDFRNVSSFNHNLTRFLLSGAHAKLKSQCVDCHKPTKHLLPTKPSKRADKFIFEHASSGFCVDCHTSPHKGQFAPAFLSDNCQQCHSVRNWTPLTSFNHDKTRFKLVDAHAKIKNKCSLCHVKTNKMLPTKPPIRAGKFVFEHADQQFCVDCHKSVHKQQFDAKFEKQPCGECHTQVSFSKRLPFDHDKTDFRLTGAHALFKNTCEKCHVKTKNLLATKPPKAADKFQFAHQKTGYCEACHTDEHTGQFHKKFAQKPCRECHTTVNFDKRFKFNHDLARFDLTGEHAKIKCVACHVHTHERFKQAPHHFKGKYIFTDLSQKNCNECHKDPHDGRFGKQCEGCHNTESWKDAFEFHKNMLLGGSHYLLDCSDCHGEQQRLLSGIGNDCKSCHFKDDPHQGTQPDCKSCHNQLFWSATTFKHGLTDFPLRGAHRLASCSECHGQGVYQGLDTQCVSCHIGDAHKVTFPNHSLPGFEQCDTCHNQFSFQGASKS